MDRGGEKGNLLTVQTSTGNGTFPVGIVSLCLINRLTRPTKLVDPHLAPAVVSISNGRINFAPFANDFHVVSNAKLGRDVRNKAFFVSSAFRQ